MATARFPPPARRPDKRFMERLTTRCSTIFIATGDRMRVYHDVDDIPAELRRKLIASTRGANSATILIADRAGREQILKAMRRARAGRYSRLASILINAKTAPARRRSRLRLALPLLGRILLVGSLGYLFWVLAAWR